MWNNTSVQDGLFTNLSNTLRLEQFEPNCKSQFATILKHTSKHQQASGSFNPNQSIPTFQVDIDHGVFFVLNPQISDILFLQFGFGRKKGHNLILSPFEIYFLAYFCKFAQLTISNDELYNLCCMLGGQEMFPIRYSVYHYYRTRHWIVKSGVNFGSDFVLYEDHPDRVHSKYCVQIVRDWAQITNQLITSARVGWAVHKETLLVKVSGTESLDIHDPNSITNLTIDSITVKRDNFT